MEGLSKMKSTLFTIGPFTAHGYGLMIAIGALVAYKVGEYRAKKYNLRDDLIFDLTIWCLVGGLLGAKLLYLITKLPEIMANPENLLDYIKNGFVVYGGIILGIFAGWLYTRRKKLNFWKYFDIVMPEIALAQGFGRIGCFLAGCCYGEETQNVLHVVFHDSPIAPNGVQLIPTQVYSSLFNFLHFFVLITIAKKKKADGQIAGLYLIIYSLGRFVIEFFRGDIERGQIGILSTSQFISIFIFAVGILLYAFAKKISGAKIFAVEEAGAAIAEETAAVEEITENNDEKED